MTEIAITTSGAPQERLSGDLFARFAAFIDAKPKTIETYRRAIAQMFRYFSENHVPQPTRETILAYRDYLAHSGHKPTTIQNYIAAARLFFRWTEQEHIYPNIADKVKGAKLDRSHKKDYLTSTQAKEVLGGIDRATERGARDYAILALMMTGGLRTIEIVRANVEDLRTLGDSTVLYIQGKGRDERTEYVKIAAPTERAIRDYLRFRSHQSPTAPLFTSTSNNSKGERMTTRSISGIAKAGMVNAGYNSERLTAHSLRHTAVTLALLADRPLEEVQQFARHANIQTTLIYSHALDKAKNQCSEAISSAIF